MGYYVNETKNGNGLSGIGKAAELVLDGATVVAADDVEGTFDHLNENEALVCVVENGHFDAAAYAHSRAEMVEFKWSPIDPRNRTWLLMDDKQWVHQVTGYK